MKNTIIGGCFGLLAAVLAVFLGHYLTKENIDVRYTLSDSIPANFLGQGSKNNVQQLDIINKGDKSAEKLRIKLENSISQYELTKYSVIDKVEENLSNRNLEILYPELPPEGKIKIVFSSNVLPLNKEDVKISHSKGIGKEAFDEKNSFIYSVSFIFLVYLFLFVSFFVVESLTLRNKWLERDAFRGDEKIFTRKKAPLFMSVDRWYELRKEAIENHIKKSRLSSYDIEDSKIVSFLNSEKPEYLKDHEWEFLLKESQDFFVEKIPSVLELSFYYERNVERFFKINKPKHIQQYKWDEILKKLHGLYILGLKEAAINPTIFQDAKDIFKKLKCKNTYNVNEKLWSDYRKILKYIYKYCLVNGLSSQYESHVDYINQYDLSILDKPDDEFIRELAYKFQQNTRYLFPFTLETAQKFHKADKEEWLKDKDYKELKTIAKDVVGFHAEKARTNSLKNLLNQICFRQTIPKEKPNELNDEEWVELKKLEKNMVELLAENKGVLSKNEEILKKIEEKEKFIPSLIEKLNFQLSAINEFLSDPSVLDRIEDYNNTFSPGNIRNLKQISAHLKNIQKV